MEVHRQQKRKKDMKKIISIALLAILTYSSSALGQTVQKITLQDAINIALENNFQLKQANNNLDLSEKSITSEYADFLPNISASLSGSRQTGRQFIQETATFGDATSQSINGSLRASIPIFNGFQNLYSLKISQNNQESAEEELQRAKETVIFTAATRFLQVLLDQQLLEIARENLVTSVKQLEQIQAQVDVGSRASVDGFNQESTVANNELTVTQRENSLQLNKLLLVRQLQIDPLGNYEFVTPDISENNVTNANTSAYDLSTLIDQAIATRADYKSEVISVQNLEYQLMLAKMSLVPTLSANASISTGYSDQYSIPDPLNPGQRQNVDFGEQFFDQRVGRGFGFSVNIPLFNNWNRMYNIQSSKVSVKNAELSLDNSRLQIIQEVTQAYTDYSSIIKQFDASKKSVIASEKAFETQQERYNVGASTLIELSQAQATYVTAQSNFTQALYNLVFQEKLLDFYLGKLSGESVEF